MANSQKWPTLNKQAKAVQLQRASEGTPRKGDAVLRSMAITKETIEVGRNDLLEL